MLVTIQSSSSSLTGGPASVQTSRDPAGMVSHIDHGEANPKAQFKLCVFCGSSSGLPQHQAATMELASCIAAQSWSLVYGGGTRGLMGCLAREVVQLRGPSAVHGIIPETLLTTERGIVHPREEEYGKTTVVRRMHDRKALMMQEADAFVALPGGYGTMEELFEITTWNQLGIHDRPIVLFNVDGFFDPLIQWVDKAAAQGFIHPGQREILSVANTADEVVTKIMQYRVAKGRFVLDWNRSKHVL